MSGVMVTVYNDDSFGRDIHVAKIGGVGGEKLQAVIQKPEDACGTKCTQYEIKKGEMLIIVGADYNG